MSDLTLICSTLRSSPAQAVSSELASIKAMHAPRLMPDWPGCRVAFTSCWPETGLQGRDEFRHSREQVGFQAVVGHAEDRRFRVFVNRDDDLAVLHAGQV